MQGSHMQSKLPTNLDQQKSNIPESMEMQLERQAVFRIRHSGVLLKKEQIGLSTGYQSSVHSFFLYSEFWLRLAYSAHRSSKNHSIPLIRLFEMSF